MATNTKKWRIFSVVAAGVFMSTLDSSMINIALPSIMAEFQSPLRDTEWVVLIYLLTITASLLIWGNLSDTLGRQKIYPLGLVVFAASSLACAYAPTLACLIGARFFQALGAGMMMSTGPAIIKENFPAAQLGRSLGLISIAVSLGLMSGPVLGGFLLELFSWRALFWVTVPLGLFFAVLGKQVIPPADHFRAPSPFSRASAVSWGLLLTFFSLAITYASSPVWSSTIFLGLMVLSLLAFFAFSWSEQRAATPLLPLALLRQRYFYSALICAVLSFMMLFAILVLTPFFLDRVMQMTMARIGLIMMTIPLAVLLVAPTAGWLSEHIPAKKLSTLGLVLSTTGILLLSRLTAQSTTTEIITKLALLGCGQAMFLTPNSASVLKRATNSHSGRAAALLATARNLGMLLGIGQASLVFSHQFSRLTGGLDLRDFTPLHTSHFLAALQAAFLTTACFGLVGIIVSWRREK